MEKSVPERGAPGPRIPVSTYRLQFNHRFRFSDALKIIPYLNELGITDIYASPYFKARKGSMHGYDIVDPTTINPEVGTEEEYDAMVRELEKYSMGQLLDIVPNHMSIGSENPWWMDVLENGPCSPTSKYFDIDWLPDEEILRYKLLVPILGDQFGTVLESQGLRLAFEEGSFFVHYYDHKLPLQPNSYTLILERDVERLENITPPENTYVTELLSIVTAVKHLPQYTETDAERIAERYREKEIIKKRLFKLYSDSPEIKDHIDRNVMLFNGVKGDAKSFDLIEGLLDEQIWRLSNWRVANEEINYRRFFDINGMAGVRVEDPAVFAETHKLILKLVSERKVTGLRIDHPDGLYNPLEYLGSLQQACFSALSGHDSGLISDPGNCPFYIVAEKILTRGEKMPEDWPVFGTTGYGFLNSLNGIFVATKNAKLLDRVYSHFVRENINYPDVAYEKKKLVMQVAMSGEIHTLGNYIRRITVKDRHTRDFTVANLTKALTEIVAFFPVYRTYINTLTATDRDRQYIEPAIARAKRKNPAVSASIYDFLKAVLLLKFPDDIGDNDKMEWLDFVRKFQQLTAPVMAKGLEDTAFYVYNRLVSLNEVGGSPDRFGLGLEVFHGQNIERIKNWPHTLIATSTHDTKHDEDVRARINVLSEMPEKWRRFLTRCSALNKHRKTTIEGQPAPDRNKEYLLYQNMIGAWPLDPVSGHEYGIFKDRLKAYMLKAMREAKTSTSWISPNTAYEDDVMSFLDSILTDRRGNRFLQEFRVFQKMISHYGIFNSLSQTLLKIASPGIPDFYQGTELMEYSLVDPDNRRQVDYELRIDMLDELKKREAEVGTLPLASELSSGEMDGRIKLYLTYKALNYRRKYGLLFMEGAYLPLSAEGNRKEHVCSFARTNKDKTVLVVVPRFVSSLVPGVNEPPIGVNIWGETWIVVPDEISAGSFRDIFTGETIMAAQRPGERILYLRDVLARFPVAMLEGNS